QDIHINLAEILSLKNVVNALINYEIHLAIANQYITNEGIDAIPIHDEKLVVILPPNHSLQYKSQLAMNDLIKKSAGCISIPADFLIRFRYTTKVIFSSSSLGSWDGRTGPFAPPQDFLISLLQHQQVWCFNILN